MKKIILTVMFVAQTIYANPTSDLISPIADKKECPEVLEILHAQAADVNFEVEKRNAVIKYLRKKNRHAPKGRDYFLGEQAIDSHMDTVDQYEIALEYILGKIKSVQDFCSEK